MTPRVTAPRVTVTQVITACAMASSLPCPLPLPQRLPALRSGPWRGAARARSACRSSWARAAIGDLVAPDASGDLAIAARLVLHSAAASAGRLLDLARRAREVPARSRSELLAELLISESAVNEDLLDRARQLNVALGGWHVAVRIEADDLDGPGLDGSGPGEAARDEVRRYELLEAAGQIALQAAAAAGGTWYLSRVARAIVLIKMTTSDPGPQAGAQAARSAARALAALRERLPALPFRAGVGSAHEGPTGLRASAAEAGRRSSPRGRPVGRPGSPRTTWSACSGC